MRQKIAKILTKILILLPISFAFYFLNYDNWFTITLFSLFLPSAFVFWNWFDYEKFSEMKSVDFLESSHILIIDDSKNEFNDFLIPLKNKIKSYTINKISENHIEVEVENRLINSIISLEKVEAKIFVRIRRKYLSFFPDRAENFKLIHELFPNKSYS